MIAEILSVGTELLLGDIVNTNAQFLSKELARLGISVHYQTVVGDNADRIKSALAIGFNRADIIIMTGGLGPTKDDLTKEIIAEYFGSKLVFDQKAYDLLEYRVHKYGVEKISDSNRKQAFVPENSIVLYNDNGTAPGYILQKDNKTAILFPGPPNEMQPMFKKACDIFLNQLCDHTFVSINIKLKSKGEDTPENTGESSVADKITHLLDNSNPTVATYAKEDYVLIRVTASAKTRKDALELIAPVLDEIKMIIGSAISSVFEG